MADGQTWYYAQNGEQHGPYGADEMAAFVRQGALMGETLVWNPSLSDWAQLRETSLGRLLGDAPAAPPPSSASSGSVPSVGRPSLAKGRDTAGPAAATPLAGAAPDRDDADLSMWEYFLRAVTRDYAQFQGRARRKEYWSYVLFSFLFIFGATFVAVFVFGEGFADLVNLVVSLAFLIPGLGALVRRLHDRGYSGWLALLMLIPLVGAIALLVLTVLPSEPSANKHGPVPAGVDVA